MMPHAFMPIVAGPWRLVIKTNWSTASSKAWSKAAFRFRMFAESWLTFTEDFQRLVFSFFVISFWFLILQSGRQKTKASNCKASPCKSAFPGPSKTFAVYPSPSNKTFAENSGGCCAPCGTCLNICGTSVCHLSDIVTSRTENVGSGRQACFGKVNHNCD